MKRFVAVAASLVLAATLIGCSGDKKDETAEPGATTTAPDGPVAALTGLPLDDEAIRNRPLLTVKVDNHPQARPQFGIDRADVIVEEKVEGDLSRFMALFQSQDADRVGPVRSLRSTDAAWLKPVGGMIAYSGGIDPVRALLPKNGVADIGADTHGPKYYKRRSDRPFEHGMYTNTNVLREDLTPKAAKAPPALFAYTKAGEAFGGATATPVASVSTQMGTVSTATRFDWTWDAGAGVFRRGTDGKAHEIEGQGQIGMKNVIIQMTPYRATQWRDRANSVVDEAVVIGSGEAFILSDGKLVRGRWERSGDAPTKFTDSAGAEVKLQPGHTWLSMVPQGQNVEVR